jgi:cobalamin synthase
VKVACVGWVFVAAGLATRLLPLEAVGLAAAGGILAMVLVGSISQRKVGGISGDFVGAANETVEITVLATGLLWM